MILARLAFADGHRIELMVSDDVRALSIPQAGKPPRVFGWVMVEAQVATFIEQRVVA